MIFDAYGQPARMRPQLMRLTSATVEDSAVVTFDFPTTTGVHYSSWSLPGYERQENRLSIRTDRGELVMTTTLSAFRSIEGSVEVEHQLDHETGFNIAPDYSGAGISAELRVLTGGDDEGAVSVERAATIERGLFALYEHADWPLSFVAPPRESSVAVATPRADRDDVILDARSAALLGTPPAEIPWDRSWAAVEVDIASLPLALRHIDGGRLRVTVPNFLPQARLLSERRYGPVVRGMGTGGALVAAREFAGVLASERGATFWAGVTALVAAELARLPRSFRGSVLLHPYIADLAIALEQYERLDRLLRLLRSSGREIGLHSNLARLATNAVALLTTTPEILSVLASPRSTSVLSTIRVDLASADRLRRVHLTAEVGPAPLFVHHAAAASELEISGADSMLVSALVDPQTFQAVERGMRTRWDRAFPGVELPSSVMQ
jgi:hypothetical protein